MRGLMIGMVGALALYGLSDLGLRAWDWARERWERHRRRRSLRLAKRLVQHPAAPPFPWFPATLLSVFIVSMVALALFLESSRPSTPPTPPRMGEEIRIQQPRASWSEPVRMDATYYHPRYAGRTTASGDRYQPDLLTAAHRTLPFGAQLEVTGPAGRAVVRITDRGPWCLHGPACALPCRRADLDLSEAAARLVGVFPGRADVQVRRRL